MPNLTIHCEQQTLRPFIPALEQQVVRLAAHLKLECDLTLSPVELRKSGAHTQGLRVQAYDQSDVEPVVLLLFQPGDEDSCWLWRLQFPSGTDVQLMYGRLSLAIEKGQHLVDAKKMNGHAGHTSTASIPTFTDEQLAQSAKGLERHVGQGEMAKLIVIELRKGLAMDQIEFDATYACSRLLRADSHYKGDTARVVLRAITNRMLVNHNSDSGMYRFGARGTEILNAYDEEQARLKAQQEAEAIETSQRAVAATPKRIKSPDWEDNEPDQERDLSNQRVSVFMQNPDNVALAMRFVCSHGDWSMDAAPVLRRGFVLDKLIQSAQGAMQRRDAGRVLSAFIKRGYFEHFKDGDLVQINPAGLVIARACRISDVPPWARPFRSDVAPAPRESDATRSAAAPPHVQVSRVGLFESQPTQPIVVAEAKTSNVGPDYIRDLATRVAKFDEAKKIVDTAEARINQISTELSGMEAKISVLKAERDKLAASLVESRAVVADTQYLRAAEELASIKAMLGLK